MRSSKPGVHHVAYACRDIDATHHFYEELMGFHLVHTEVVEKDGGFFRHTFYDTGDGSCLAFFDLHGVGEKDDWSSAISTGNGLPVWVNHVAFSATEERQAEVKRRMTAAGIEPLMEINHGRHVRACGAEGPRALRPDDESAILEMLAARRLESG